VHVRHLVRFLFRVSLVNTDRIYPQPLDLENLRNGFEAREQVRSEAASLFIASDSYGAGRDVEPQVYDTA
jgi:hypothetical protein